MPNSRLLSIPIWGIGCNPLRSAWLCGSLDLLARSAWFAWIESGVSTPWSRWGPMRVERGGFLKVSRVSEQMWSLLARIVSDAGYIAARYCGWAAVVFQHSNPSWPVHCQFFIWHPVFASSEGRNSTRIIHGAAHRFVYFCQHPGFEQGLYHSLVWAVVALVAVALAGCKARPCWTQRNLVLRCS